MIGDGLTFRVIVGFYHNNIAMGSNIVIFRKTYLSRALRFVAEEFSSTAGVSRCGSVIEMLLYVIEIFETFFNCQLYYYIVLNKFILIALTAVPCRRFKIAIYEGSPKCQIGS